MLPVMSAAKGGREHIQDMIDVYPFKVQPGDAIYTFFECVQAAIDYSEFSESFNPETQKPISSKKPSFLYKCPFKNTKWGNHRIWYHWGFNADVRLFSPLTLMVNENIAKGLMREEDRDLFYQCLYQEIGKRNKELMRWAAKVLGYPSTGWSGAMREQLNAFVAIPYAVHLIGDRFKEYSVTSVVQPMDDIVKSVYNAIDDLAGSGNSPEIRANKQKAMMLKKELSRHTATPEDFLAALKTNLPQYMLSLQGELYDFNKKSKRLGYKVK